jgi:8-oxo-dGTP diphosphatase
MNDWSKIEGHVSKVILFDGDGKLVIYLRDDKLTIPFPNIWDLLGGGVEENETPEQAAVRELEEEVGVPVNEVHKVSEYVVMGKWLFHIFRAKIDMSVTELTLTEGQHLQGIKLTERQNYLQGVLAAALEHYVSKFGA